MGTEITVIVGADGLRRADDSLRTARRRDRLDTEALRKDLQGLKIQPETSANPADKNGAYAPNRDPAAHARKGDALGNGILCVNIREQWFSQSYSLQLNGINEDGVQTQGTSIEWSSRPAQLTSLTEAQLPLGNYSKPFLDWIPPNDPDAAVCHTDYRARDMSTFTAVQWNVLPAGTLPINPGIWDGPVKVIPANGGIPRRYYPSYAQGPGGSVNADWGLLNADRWTVKANNQAIKYFLPYSEKLGFLAVLVRDIPTNFKRLDKFQHYTATTSEGSQFIPGTTIDPINETWTWYSMNANNTYVGSAYPLILDPQGNVALEYRDNVNKLHLFQVTPQAVTEIPEAQIPLKLRQAISKIHPAPWDKTPEIQSNTYKITKIDIKCLFPSVGTGGALYQVDDQSYNKTITHATLWRQLYDGLDDKSWGYFDYNSSYNWLMQSYGIGYLETENHALLYSTDVPKEKVSQLTFGDYITGLVPKATKGCFSPAIYTFLNEDVEPFSDDNGWNYALVRQKLPDTTTTITLNGQEETLFVPARNFINIKGRPYGDVRLTGYNPTIATIESPYNGSYDKEWTVKQVIPTDTGGLISWNWGNPWYCYDELLKLGFTANLLGPRPSTNVKS